MPTGLLLKFGLPILAAIGLIWSIAAHFGDDRDTRDALAIVKRQAAHVLVATRSASDNPKLGWKETPGQIVALGESNRALKGAISLQNKAIDELAREAVRLRARAAELKRIADKAEAQRTGALRRLADLTITPGTRGDCMKLLSEAETALDLVKEAGL